MLLLTYCAQSGRWRPIWSVLWFLALFRGHLTLQRDSSRYSLYTFRTARSDEGDNYDSYSRNRSPVSQPYYTSSTVRFPATNGAPPAMSPKASAVSYAPSSTPLVIRHPSSCSYDRSHAACTFSLLCYLANGVPVEGCEDNSSMTCCYLNPKGVNAATASNKGESRASSMYRQYPAASSESTLAPGSSVSTFRAPASYHSASNSVSNYYNPSNSYRTVPYPSTEAAPSNTQVNVESSGYLDYKQKADLLAPYESKSQGVGKQDSDYYSNAIRRTRTDTYKSFFQEIANRKLYARNYDVEDSKQSCPCLSLHARLHGNCISHSHTLFFFAVCGKPIAKPRSRIIGGQVYLTICW